MNQRAGVDMDRVDAALEAAFPSTPLNVLSRRINRLAELLPKGHECEPIFGEFDAVGEYVRALEYQNDALRSGLGSARDFIAHHPAVRGEWPLLLQVIDHGLSATAESEQTTPTQDDTLGPPADTNVDFDDRTLGSRSILQKGTTS